MIDLNIECDKCRLVLGESDSVYCEDCYKYKNQERIEQLEVEAEKYRKEIKELKKIINLDYSDLYFGNQELKRKMEKRDSYIGYLEKTVAESKIRDIYEEYRKLMGE